MTKERAKQLWERYQWHVAVILLPLALWAAKKYDASKVDTHAFEVFVNGELAKDVLREVRDSARYDALRRHQRYTDCLVLQRRERPCAHLLMSP